MYNNHNYLTRIVGPTKEGAGSASKSSMARIFLAAALVAAALGAVCYLQSLSAVLYLSLCLVCVWVGICRRPLRLLALRLFA